MKPHPTTILYLYGPPAAGKTTVALALQKTIAYPILHPHLFTPILSTFMGGDVRTNRPFRTLGTTLRMAAIRAALKAQVPGLILTGVYTHKVGKNYFIEWLKKVPARVVFVRLTASEASLMRRVTANSRKRFDLHKITTREKLHERMTERSVISPITGVSSFTIDTDKVKPKAAALAIIRKYKLKS